MTRRGRLLVAAVATAALLVIGVGARAQSPTAPQVALQVAVDSRCDCILDTAALTATATPSDGRTIASVEFQFREQGTETWMPIVVDATAPYQASWATTFPDRLFGLFEVRAVATDSAGEQTVAVVRDRPVANGGGALVLEDPGAVLPARVTLRASMSPNVGFPVWPSQVRFEISEAGEEDWRAIGIDNEAAYPDGMTPTFTVELSSSDLTGGSYDIRAVPSDEFDPNARFISAPRRGLRLDREGPRVELTVPPGPLSGVAQLSATASDDSGVASVRFERAVAGTGTWLPIDAQPHEPFAIGFDTRSVSDGTYDLRAIATDTAGNRTVSEPVTNVPVSNPGRDVIGDPAVTSVMAPARGMTLLGTTTSGETWAWGLASGAPAIVDGAPLPYTARGGQLVLLRHTEASGWQIRDVLRDADGTAFPYRAGTSTSAVVGAMAANGEAWLALRQPDGSGGVEGVLFHRLPGGDFRLDAAATQLLAPLLTGTQNDSGKRLQLATAADGRLFGMLLAPGQTLRQAGAVSERLRYGLLDDGEWQLKTLSRPLGYTARAGDEITLAAADLTAPATGWVAVTITNSQDSSAPQLPPRIGRLTDGPWDPVTTGLDVLDATDAFATSPLALSISGLRATDDGVWIGTNSGLQTNVVAYYDEAAGDVTRSWCGSLGVPSVDCRMPLDADHPAAVPDQVFETANGTVAVSLQANFLHTFAYGAWTRSAAPGFSRGTGRLLLRSPEDGWLAGEVAAGRVTPAPPRPPLASWPQANRSTLLDIALPPGASGRIDEPGALAVGLDGTALSFDVSAGWQVQTTPTRAGRLALRGVAFAAADEAYAVGTAGIILRWDGAQWSEDPQSAQLTNAELQDVAFDRDGDGWAVGRFATILHFDGSRWTEERAPQEDAEGGATISAVAVAGDDVFAIADGNLIQRGADGQWQRVDRALLPEATAATAPFDRDLRVLAGLPDGGLVVGGRQVVLKRERAGAPFTYAEQPVEGVVVALSAFRDGGGALRAFASVAAPVPPGRGSTLGGDVGGFPAGDGALLRETADGWVDLSNSQPPLSRSDLSASLGDGLVKPDPVLAVAASADGTRAWAAGGYAGTRSAAGQGLEDVLSARPSGWRTAHLWRYDATGSAQSPADVSTPVDPAARPDDTITFAYVSNALCRRACLDTQNAQPDVNLTAALEQIEQYAAAPGGPLFAMLGGNARGPIEEQAWVAGNGRAEFERLPSLLAAAGRVPLFAAVGPRDAVPTEDEPLQPWADAFARAPAPFGPAPAVTGVTPVAEGANVGAVHRYYAFDVRQNGAVLRAIVLDNSSRDADAPPLDPEQSRWFDEQLAAAQDAGLPVILFLGQPLQTSSNGSHLSFALKLAAAHILAAFVAGDTNDYRLYPPQAALEFQFPLISGGALGYQQTANNGVSWLEVTIDVAARNVDVQAHPLLETLALKPLLGLTVNRSQTLNFEAIGRRPSGTLATTPSDPAFPGFDNYVTIPAPPCASVVCITPGYRFDSSDPTIGEFVIPRGPGSRYPLLSGDGRPIRSAASGLFCAYNAGTTTVSITVGTRRAELPVTVLAGGFGRPCGTVYREGQRQIIRVPSTQTRTSSTPRGNPVAPTQPPPPATAQDQPPVLPDFAVPFPPPPPPPVAEPPAPPAPRVPPAVLPPPAVVPVVAAAVPVPPQPPQSLPVAVPIVPPSIQPIPPGGAASAQAAARRKEKVQKHASQSAFSTHAPGEPWFYGAVGAATVLTLLLIAGGVRPDPRRRAEPALLKLDERRRP